MKSKPGNSKKEKTSWGNVATWYDEHLEGNEDTYQKQVILPNLLRMLAIKKDERVLDIACGQGFFSRALSNSGAEVVGADISRELIALASERPEKNISYVVARAEKLTFAENSSFDAAIMVLAMQNIEDMGSALSEIKRVLKESGRCILVLNHPAFRIPQHSDWGFDDKKKTQFRSVDRYLSSGKITLLVNPSKKDSAKTFTYHRSLQDFYKAFAKAGLVVTRLEEWISHKVSQSGPRAKAEDTARKEIPLFLALELQSISVV